jgi:putative SOS response-associated peptidase YedK
MCGRYTNTLDPQALEQRFGLRLPFSEGSRRYNVAPTESVVGIVLDKTGQAESRVLRWGLIPSWAKSGRVTHTMINARSETAGTKPTYRDLIGKASRRALLPADGFYEWLRSEDPKQPRLPFRFTVDEGGPFAFAALWTPGWRDGEPIASTTILTCRANSVVGRLHDRMPVILPDRASELAWLRSDVDGHAALEMCLPLADDRMHVWPANPAVNKAGGPEGPELLVAGAG